jgi:hypothetical protein
MSLNNYKTLEQGVWLMESVNVEVIENKLIELENEVEELRRIIVLSRLKCLSIKSEKEKICENK